MEIKLKGDENMLIKSYIEKEKDYIISLRRYFHKNPEESLNEYNTAKKIEEELNKFGIYNERVGETGVIGIINGKKESDNVVALRADIDALKVSDLKMEEYKSKVEGLCHSCGHDAHTASLLGAAKILKEKEEEIKGQVRLIFQQAEEIGQGAKIFIKEGYLDKVNSIFGIHVASDLDVGKVAVVDGPICASCDYFKIKVYGKTAHVSNPHMSIDSLYIASQIVVNLQSIVSRNTSPTDTVVVGVGVLKAGTTYNAVAGEAVLEGTSRAFTKESREKTNKLIVKIAESIATAYGATVTIEFKDYASPLINNSDECRYIEGIAKDIIGSNNLVKNREKSLGADDFAEFLLDIPGVYAQVGTKNVNKPNTCVAHHNEFFDIDEEALLVATSLEVEYVLKKLS